ncbi:MAG: hypothetical protein J6R47_00195 [Acholeplasmatales bacterium]|nr:hypothetical protein [Acholeplasmatales bacterium]
MNIPAYVKGSKVPVKIIGFVTDDRSAIAVCVRYDGSINEYRIDKLEILAEKYRPYSEVTA